MASFHLLLLAKFFELFLFPVGQLLQSILRSRNHGIEICSIERVTDFRYPWRLDLLPIEFSPINIAEPRVTPDREVTLSGATKTFAWFDLKESPYEVLCSIRCICIGIQRTLFARPLEACFDDPLEKSSLVESWVIVVEKGIRTKKHLIEHYPE